MAALAIQSASFTSTFPRMGAYSPATTRKTDRRMRSSRQSFALTWRDKNSLLVGSFALMPGQAEMS